MAEAMTTPKNSKAQVLAMTVSFLFLDMPMSRSCLKPSGACCTFSFPIERAMQSLKQSEVRLVFLLYKRACYFTTIFLEEICLKRPLGASHREQQ